MVGDGRWERCCFHASRSGKLHVKLQSVKAKAKIDGLADDDSLTHSLTPNRRLMRLQLMDHTAITSRRERRTYAQPTHRS